VKNLKNYVLRWTSRPDPNITSYAHFTDEHRQHIKIVSDTIFRHKTLQLMYTTYDMQEDHDRIYQRLHPDIMVLSDDEEHPYLYSAPSGTHLCHSVKPRKWMPSGSSTRTRSSERYTSSPPSSLAVQDDTWAPHPMDTPRLRKTIGGLSTSTCKHPNYTLYNVCGSPAWLKWSDSQTITCSCGSVVVALATCICARSSHGLMRLGGVPCGFCARPDRPDVAYAIHLTNPHWGQGYLEMGRNMSGTLQGLEHFV